MTLARIPWLVLLVTVLAATFWRVNRSSEWDPTPSLKTTAVAEPSKVPEAVAVTRHRDDKPGIGSWTQFRGDPANTGISYSPRPQYKGLKWKYYVGSPMSSTPVVAKGKVIVASEVGYVNCIDAATGKKIWITKCGQGNYQTGITFTTPLILDDRIFVGSRSGTLYCLELETGNELFEFSTGEKEIYASPKGDERGVVVGTMSGDIWCIDPKSGKSKWKIDALREIGATAAILGDTIYVPGKDRNYYEIDYATGKIKRSLMLPGTSNCTAALGAGYSFLVTGGHKLHAIDLITGNSVWDTEATGDDQNAMGYCDGVAYAPLGAYLWALDAPTGKKFWEFRADHKISPPIINGDDILISGRDRKFRVIDRKNGKETYSIDLGEGFFSGPVLVDGVVYLAADVTDGVSVFAIE